MLSIGNQLNVVFYPDAILGSLVSNGLAGLGHVSGFLTVFTFVTDLFKEDQTAILLERFDAIDNQLDEIQYVLEGVSALIVDQKVTLG